MIIKPNKIISLDELTKKLSLRYSCTFGLTSEVYVNERYMIFAEPTSQNGLYFIDFIGIRYDNKSYYRLIGSIDTDKL